MRRVRQRPGADARVQEASKAHVDRRELIMLRADRKTDLETVGGAAPIRMQRSARVF